MLLHTRLCNLLSWFYIVGNFMRVLKTILWKHGHVFRQNYVMKEARWAHAYTMAQTVFGTAMHNGLTRNSARKPLPWAQLILRRRYE